MHLEPFRMSLLHLIAGGLSKDPTPNTCVTVCGISGQHRFISDEPFSDAPVSRV